MGMSFFQRVRPQCKVEGFYTMGRRIIIDAYTVDGFCGHCNIVVEAMGCFSYFCSRQEAPYFLTDEKIQRNINKKELDELRKENIQEKCYNFLEFYECSWWKMQKTENFVQQLLRESFSYRMLLKEERLLEKRSKLEVCLVLFKGILKYQGISGKVCELPTNLQEN